MDPVRNNTGADDQVEATPSPLLAASFVSAASAQQRNAPASNGGGQAAPTGSRTNGGGASATSGSGAGSQSAGAGSAGTGAPAGGADGVQLSYAVGGHDSEGGSGQGDDGSDADPARMLRMAGIEFTSRPTLPSFEAHPSGHATAPEEPTGGFPPPSPGPAAPPVSDDPNNLVYNPSGLRGGKGGSTRAAVRHFFDKLVPGRSQTDPAEQDNARRIVDSINRTLQHQGHSAIPETSISVNLSRRDPAVRLGTLTISGNGNVKNAAGNRLFIQNVLEQINNDAIDGHIPSDRLSQLLNNPNHVTTYIGNSDPLRYQNMVGFSPTDRNGNGMVYNSWKVRSGPHDVSTLLGAIGDLTSPLRVGFRVPLQGIPYFPATQSFDASPASRGLRAQKKAMDPQISRLAGLLAVNLQPVWTEPSQGYYNVQIGHMMVRTDADFSEAHLPSAGSYTYTKDEANQFIGKLLNTMRDVAADVQGVAPGQTLGKQLLRDSLLGQNTHDYGVTLGPRNEIHAGGTIFDAPRSEFRASNLLPVVTLSFQPGQGARSFPGEAWATPEGDPVRVGIFHELSHVLHLLPNGRLPQSIAMEVRGQKRALEELAVTGLGPWEGPGAGLTENNYRRQTGLPLRTEYNPGEIDPQNGHWNGVSPTNPDGSQRDMYDHYVQNRLLPDLRPDRTGQWPADPPE